MKHTAVILEQKAKNQFIAENARAVWQEKRGLDFQ